MIRRFAAQHSARKHAAEQGWIGRIEIHNQIAERVIDEMAMRGALDELKAHPAYQRFANGYRETSLSWGPKPGKAARSAQSADERAYIRTDLAAGISTRSLALQFGDEWRALRRAHQKGWHMATGLHLERLDTLASAAEACGQMDRLAENPGYWRYRSERQELAVHLSAVLSAPPAHHPTPSRPVEQTAPPRPDRYLNRGISM